ncbi:hypothetical protein DRQ29_07340, partial [bacterium]
SDKQSRDGLNNFFLDNWIYIHIVFSSDFVHLLYECILENPKKIYIWKTSQKFTSRFEFGE